MERKSTSARLREFKDLFTSSSSKSQRKTSSHSSRSHSHFDLTRDHVDNKNGAFPLNTKNGLSLFNLVGASTSSRTSRVDNSPKRKSGGRSPAGFHDPNDPFGFSAPPNKSVSMYGLASSEELKNQNGRSANSSVKSNRNIATRLLHNIRVRFRRQRKEHKVIDSKPSTDFGSFFGQSDSGRKSSESQEGKFSFSSTSTHSRSPHSKSALKASQSIDNVLESLGYLGSRQLEHNANTNDSQLQDRQILYDDDVEHQYENSENVFGPDSDVNSELGAPVTPTEPPFPLVLRTPSPNPAKCLTEELENLLHYGWYWGGISKDEAEVKLKGEPDGAFVVRDSSSDHYLLSLSFNCKGRTLHTRIGYQNGRFSFYSSDADDSFPTVAALIEHCIAFSEYGVFCYCRGRRNDEVSYAVKLIKPISRFTEVKSLLYLSRFVLRQYVRLDLIPLLPLPHSLIDYVSQQRYM